MAQTQTSKTALVIGAAGGAGGEIARALLAHGWRVRGLSRDPARAAAKPGPAGLEWVRGDALDAPSILAAAQGAALIVHAANPPGYRNWAGTVLPMLESAIAAAKATGARILLPGSVYNFRPDDGPVFTEASPQRPLTRKGDLKVRVEQRLRAAADDGVPVLIVRAGDFFGPRPGNNWLSQGLMAAGPGLVLDPGRRGVGHAWAYLPDLAEAMARLVERPERLGDFEVVHFAGHWLEDNREMAQAVRQALGGRPPILPFPWVMARLMAPFNETFREMLEMTYLWRRPIRLANARLIALLGEEPHTPLDVAVRASLAGQGLLAKAPAGAGAMLLA